MLRMTIAIVLTAGVSLAVAAPVTSPAQVADAPASAQKSPRSATSVVSPKSGSKASRPAASSTASSSRSTASRATSARPAASSKSAKAKSAKAARLAKAARAAKAARLAKAAQKSSKSAKTSSRRRVARANGNNMPRGFEWPPSQVMRDAEAACQRELDAAEVAWTPAASEGHIAAAVTIDDLSLGGIRYVSVYRKGPHKMDCELARTLTIIGPELAAAGVSEIHFGSIYRWSNVRVGGQTKNVLSRHALGLAMDVVSFVDAAGREARVDRDYLDGDPLLLEVERALNASGLFRIVLTPQNDPRSHHDHFHIEANPSYAPPPRS